MAKAFSVAAWNVEHFKGDPTGTNRVVGFIKQQDPNVIGLHEVEGATVFAEVKALFPGYTDQIMEGPQIQEILVGFRHILTQKIEFQSGTTPMRPGRLATGTPDCTRYGLFFLHVASSTEPRCFVRGDDMTMRAIKPGKTLEKAASGNADCIFLGIFSAMGLGYPFDSDINSTPEPRGWGTSF